MKYIYSLLLFILPFTINSQKNVEILNDSFLIVSANKVSSIQERTESLKKQIEILSKYVIKADTVIKKAIKREQSYDQEIAKWQTMDSVSIEKLTRSTTIMNNYDRLLAISNKKLEVSEKQLKKERNWKNIYKPIALVSVIYLGLKIWLG